LDFKVSVVIPAHNEEESIAKVLSALGNQDYPDLEIIVVNDCSTDRTKEIVDGFKNVRQVINEANKGLAASMNEGLKAATGDILVVLHADCIPQGPNWVADMAEPFKEAGVGAVCSQRLITDRGRLSLPEKLFDSVASQAYMNDTGRPKEILYFRDKCDAYRGVLIRQLGFFDDVDYFVSGEDTDLSIKMRRAGAKIVLSDRACINYVFSSHQRSMKAVWKKALQYGSAAAVLYKKYKYDGINARVFFWALLSAFSFAFSLLFSNVYPVRLATAIISGVLFLFSFTVWVKYPLMRDKWPLAGLFIVIFIIFSAGGLAFGASAGALSIPAAVFLGYLVFLCNKALASFRHCVKVGESTFVALLSFLFACGWRLLTGVGYFKGWIRLKTPKGQKQDVSN